ncbi:ATP-binding protein [Candidatus Woesearchaeota archaeon]|nr:ATP-binding protein [Candidatus Woesearchaeota archaeon]
MTNDNNDPDEPTEPGPLAIVDNKEDAMKTVIKQQLIYINKLRLQNNELKNLVERKQKELEHYLKPIENLEDEFKICEEDIGFSDVGGLDKVVDKLKFFEYGITYPSMYEAYAIRPPRGLLLHGPPGCGKTMLAKAISRELDCYFLEIPITRVISKWVGEAERTLEMMLQKCNDIYLQNDKKVLVFVDEAEQMFKKRGTSVGHGVLDRVVNVWLRYMDGMADGEGLIYVAATNRPEIMDDAIKRPGRFDHIVEIPTPDIDGVEDILRKQIKYKERLTGRKIYKIHNYRKIADKLYGMGATGADIAEVLRVTSEQQIRSFIEKPTEDMIDPCELPIYQFQIEDALKNYKESRSDMKEPRRIGFV